MIMFKHLFSRLRNKTNRNGYLGKLSDRSINVPKDCLELLKEHSNRHNQKGSTFSVTGIDATYTCIVTRDIESNDDILNVIDVYKKPRIQNDKFNNKSCSGSSISIPPVKLKHVSIYVPFC
jgi:hypothetical protein